MDSYCVRPARAHLLSPPAERRSGWDRGVRTASALGPTVLSLPLLGEWPPPSSPATPWRTSPPLFWEIPPLKLLTAPASLQNDVLKEQDPSVAWESCNARFHLLLDTIDTDSNLYDHY